jgi:hypothetical protein
MRFLPKHSPIIEPAADLATGKFGTQRRNETALCAEALSLKVLRAARVDVDETKIT